MEGSVMDLLFLLRSQVLDVDQTKYVSHSPKNVLALTDADLRKLFDRLENKNAIEAAKRAVMEKAGAFATPLVQGAELVQEMVRQLETYILHKRAEISALKDRTLDERAEIVLGYILQLAAYSEEYMAIMIGYLLSLWTREKGVLSPEKKETYDQESKNDHATVRLRVRYSNGSVAEWLRHVPSTEEEHLYPAIATFDAASRLVLGI